MTQPSDKFLEAWINKRHRLLGRRLYPFTLRHCLWLYAVQSPLMGALSGEVVRDVSVIDLEVFSIICSSRTDGETERLLTRLGRFRRFYAWWLCRKSPRIAQDALRSYIEDHITMPEVLTSKGEPGIQGAPWIASLAVKLSTAGLGPIEDVWNWPLGKCLWYSSILAEHAGNVVLGDAEFDEFMKR